MSRNHLKEVEAVSATGNNHKTFIFSLILKIYTVFIKSLTFILSLADSCDECCTGENVSLVCGTSASGNQLIIGMGIFLYSIMMGVVVLQQLCLPSCSGM